MTANRVFHASTMFGAMTLSAALDAGLFGDRSERRVLIVSSIVPVPELAPGFDETPAFASLRHRFDVVVRWNDLISPMHPLHWLPPDDELPMLSRLFTERLGLSDGVTELVVESVCAAPAASIASLLRHCPVTVYDAGLTSHGPTRANPRPGIGRRIERLVHLDLVPDLVTLLLHEYEVEPHPMAAAALADVIADLSIPQVGDAATAPVIIGQDLAQRDIIAVQEETELYLQMVRGLAHRGERQVVLRPHPAVVTPQLRQLRDEADRLGVELIVTADGLPAEAWFAAARPSLVVSCFSTALLTAARHHGLDVATMGTDLVLERLAPFEHSDRIPATIVDATLPRLQADGSLVAAPVIDVQRLVGAVAYCMQADRLPDLRAMAEAHVAEHGAERYFKRRRLEMLGLVAPPPPKPPPPPVPIPTRLARRLLADVRTVADKRLTR